MSWQSEGVRSIELPAAQVHAPLAVSAERGVACAFVGVQRAVVLDLVGLQASQGRSPCCGSVPILVPMPIFLLKADTNIGENMSHPPAIMYKSVRALSGGVISGVDLFLHVLQEDDTVDDEEASEDADSSGMEES